MPQYRYLEVRTANGVVVARFTEERLTEEIAIAKIGEELRSLVADGDCRKVLLSFAVVTYMSSAMLGKLITTHKALKGKGGELKLCKLCPNIQEIFTLMKLNKIIDIRDSEDEAIKAFG